MRLACDTGGTFTDLVVTDVDGALHIFKASTTPVDPVDGIFACLEQAAAAFAVDVADLLAGAETFIHGTTAAINAIITGRTARTALLLTSGHPDVLVLREGGRIEPFNHTIPYPEPYIPRRLTFEIEERIGPAGEVLRPLDETQAREVIAGLAKREVEAVAVCLLWSIANPTHEERLLALLEEMLPNVPCTLSHRLNPTLREYRRAMSAAIDASLKPLMSSYLGSLERRLAAAGFGGRVLVLTSQGGALDAAGMAEQPILAVNSGPSMAPVAGRYYAAAELGADSTIVTDTGGTTFDVSLVRGGHIPLTRDTWLGEPHRSDLTGFPSVDVKSIGAGGGSIAWVDGGGVLHVGPGSAGAVPGPVCYGQGGARATMTDAALVLGHIDADHFLEGAMRLDAEAARAVIAEQIAAPLGLELDEAAAAILDVVTERMVQAIAAITVNQGIDPERAVLIGGGGAAGLNVGAIARRLGCHAALVPETGATLSAFGAAICDITQEFRQTLFMTSERFAMEDANRVIDSLGARCNDFADAASASPEKARIVLGVEARYPHQIWEIDVPLPVRRFERPADVEALRQAFHRQHEEIFAIQDPGSAVEIVGWTARVTCPTAHSGQARLAVRAKQAGTESVRHAYFTASGRVEVPVLGAGELADGAERIGPAIVELPFTTVIVEPGAHFRGTPGGALVMHP